jgi:Ca-activated chloride channel family protein
MYILREYAAFGFIALLLTVSLVALCGIGYVVKVMGFRSMAVLRDFRFPVPMRLMPVRVKAFRSRYLLLFVLVPALSLMLRAQKPAAPAASDSPYTINVSVDEVVLHATVRNRKGTPVAGLAKENFQVFEDRVVQRLKHFSHEDIPVTVGIVIDNSGSMAPKRAEVIAAALAFAASSNPLDQMFLINFNEQVTFGLPQSVAFTDEPNQLKDAMRSVKADGKTALYDAVAVALDHLKQGNRDKKVLIVVSDGADNASKRSKAEMLDLAAKSNAIIYAVGIYEPDDPDRSPHVLKELSDASGGEAYFPAELRNVVPVCERIAREIRNQYTLSYIPANQKQDGTYRAIQVRAATPEGRGLAVTTRVGYFAPKPTNKSEARN